MAASPTSCPMELWALYPELWVAGLALLLVPVAGWARGKWRYAPVWVAAIGLMGAMWLTARMLPWAPLTIFCGTYAVDGLANGFKLLIEAGALLSLVLCWAYFRNHSQIAHMPPALLFATLGGMGLTASLDLVLIVLFLQMLSMASYLLICLRRKDPMGNEATLKYFIFAATALAIMAYGFTFLYGLTGSLNLLRIGAVLDHHTDALWLIVALGLILVGYGFEMAAVPFHFWAPDVFQGATAPVSGFISVVPKLAVFGGVLRLLITLFPQEGLNWPPIVAFLAASSMLVGNLAALRQSRLKRLLAYSSIAQAGYVLMAVTVAARIEGAAGAAGFYLAAFLFMNLGAFAVAAQMEKKIGSDALTAFQGMSRLAPWPSAVLTLCLLSLAGIPPLAGFAGKVMLLEAALAGGFVWLAVFAAVNMTVGLYYYVAVAAQIYLRPPHPAAAAPETGVLLGFTLAACLGGTLLFGIFPELLLGLTAYIGQIVGMPSAG